MRRIAILIALVASAAPARAATFREAPILEDAGIQRLNRAVAREQVDRDLFAAPYATVVVGHVDVYDVFPYVESRWFQVVSDPAWNRLLAGEMGGRVAAFDAAATTAGQLRQPRGLATDEYDRIWVADSGNDRILVCRTSLKTVIGLDGVDFTAEVLDARQELADDGTPLNTGIVNTLELIQGHMALDFADLFQEASKARLQIGRAGLTTEELRDLYEVTPLAFDGERPLPADEVRFDDEGGLELRLGLAERDPAGSFPLRRKIRARGARPPGWRRDASRRGSGVNLGEHVPRSRPREPTSITEAPAARRRGRRARRRRTGAPRHRGRRSRCAYPCRTPARPGDRRTAGAGSRRAAS